MRSVEVCYEQRHFYALLQNTSFPAIDSRIGFRPGEGRKSYKQISGSSEFWLSVLNCNLGIGNALRFCEQVVQNATGYWNE